MGQKLSSTQKFSEKDICQMTELIQTKSTEADILHQRIMLQKSKIKSLKREMDFLGNEANFIRDSKRNLQKKHVYLREAIMKFQKAESSKQYQKNQLQENIDSIESEINIYKEKLQGTINIQQIKVREMKIENHDVTKKRQKIGYNDSKYGTFQ
eukprot:NODE_46_length_32145_cov_0.918711.p26 type:complete len:154 gc:universal NODE_46_length_32145_cov_0.918711:22900-22439(-)